MAIPAAAFVLVTHISLTNYPISIASHLYHLPPLQSRRSYTFKNPNICHSKQL